MRNPKEFNMKIKGRRAVFRELTFLEKKRPKIRNNARTKSPLLGPVLKSKKEPPRA
jgi:hypothetical protein